MEHDGDDQDEFIRVIRSDSDPQVFEGAGEEVEIVFHSQDLDRLPLSTPRKFVVETDNDHPEFNRFTEIGEDLLHPVILIHRKDKAISPENFFEPDAIQAKNKIKVITIGAGIIAAAGGLTWLIVKSRRK